MAIAPQNELIHFYKPGADITGYASAAVTGKRCVKISGARTAGPGLNTSVLGGNVRVAHADAGSKQFGVAKWDAAANTLVGVTREGVVPITSSANITAGQQVEITANGMVAPLASGIAIGVAVNTTTSGNDAEIALY